MWVGYNDFTYTIESQVYISMKKSLCKKIFKKELKEEQKILENDSFLNIQYYSAYLR